MIGRSGSTFLPLTSIGQNSVHQQIMNSPNDFLSGDALSLNVQMPEGYLQGTSISSAINDLYANAAKEQRDFDQASAREAMEHESNEAQLNREWQQASAREAMDHESNEAQLNREWQEMMSNTAYQRAVADLKAAGLNPALAYQQGGAATTSGSTASGFASSGSTASGFKANATKAEVDTTALVEIVKQYMQTALQMDKAGVEGAFKVITSAFNMLG